MLLDEVVAFAFLGSPPVDIKGATVLHFDGDAFNCRVDNLRWLVCPEWTEYATEREVRRLMRPDHLPNPQRRLPPEGQDRKRTFYF